MFLLVLLILFFFFFLLLLPRQLARPSPAVVFPPLACAVSHDDDSYSPRHPRQLRRRLPPIIIFPRRVSHHGVFRVPGL